MKKHYLWLGCLFIFVVALLFFGPRSYAESPSYSHATSYYDDLVDHYEQEQIMSDFIDKGIR